MNDDTMLRQLAHKLVRAGTLPARRPDRIWGGAAFGGSTCLLCGGLVDHGGIALEVEFTGSGDSDGMSAHLHIRCFQVLDGVLSGLNGAQCTTTFGREENASAGPGATDSGLRNGSKFGTGLPRAPAGMKISAYGRGEGSEEHNGGAG